MDILAIVIHTFPMHMSTSRLVDDILPPRNVNEPTYFTGMPFKMEMIPSYLKQINSLKDYFVGIRFELVRLQEELDHVCSQRLS